jgi:hypothetical protein
MLQSSSVEAWLAWLGIAVGPLLVVGSLELVCRFEEHGWKLAATIVPIAYTAWSLWLLAPESCSSSDVVCGGHMVVGATTLSGGSGADIPAGICSFAGVLSPTFGPRDWAMT